MNISNIFIARPIATSLLMAGIPRANCRHKMSIIWGPVKLNGQ
jgi:hypothetical protein